MTTNHREKAEEWLAEAEEYHSGDHQYRTLAATIAIGHALLADSDRTTPGAITINTSSGGGDPLANLRVQQLARRASSEARV